MTNKTTTHARDLFQSIRDGFRSKKEVAQVLDIVKTQGMPLTCGQMVGSSSGLLAAETALQTKSPVII
ncbi:MAG: hypothetical protein GY869_28155, partial [Planctomycetes bacterium]|nr:hypothetical protein [Planctomycetota bacterium]